MGSSPAGVHFFFHFSFHHLYGAHTQYSTCISYLSHHFHYNVLEGGAFENKSNQLYQVSVSQMTGRRREGGKEKGEGEGGRKGEGEGGRKGEGEGGRKYEVCALCKQAYPGGQIQSLHKGL